MLSLLGCQSRRVVSLTSITLAGLMSAGCLNPSGRLYPGPARPVSELAVLWFMDDLDLTALGGLTNEKNLRAMRENHVVAIDDNHDVMSQFRCKIRVCRLEMLPGQHMVTLNNWEGKSAAERGLNDTVDVGLTTRAGAFYTIIHSDPPKIEETGDPDVPVSEQ